MRLMKKPEMSHTKGEECMACGGMACKMADGGPVLPGADTFQDSIRKATHYSEGGRVGSLKMDKSGFIDKVRPSGESAQGESVRKGDHVGAMKVAYSRRKEERNIPKGNLQGLAEGGEVEGDSDMDDLHDMVGSEMMDAIHSKDHKKMMQGLEAMVLSCMNKRRD
jgi:hypothetical protein